MRKIVCRLVPNWRAMAETGSPPAILSRQPLLSG